MSTIFLSICIPTYNRVGTLRETLDSVAPQVEGNQRVEILVSDNASTDDTPALVQEYQARYPCIRYHRNLHNLGFEGNIIACLEEASGEYVSFFSDDDIASPGMFQRILSELSTQKPAILYLNHSPFVGDKREATLSVKHPVKDISFNDGKQFLLWAGLGFISSLTLRTEYAREFIPNIKLGQDEAHIDIASRIALRKPGPFLFLGTICVEARVPTRLPYDAGVTYAAINEAAIYHRLEAEGLLDHESAKRRVSGTIGDNLLRTVLAKKCLGNHKDLDAQKALLIETYGRYWPFYIYIYPILILPRWFIRPLYLTAIKLLHLFRKLRWKGAVKGQKA